MPKLLIISLSAGAGHVRAAEAVKKTAKLKYPKLEVKHIDLADYISLAMKKTIINSYVLMAKRLPELWGFLYDKIDNHSTNKHFSQLAKQVKKINSLRLYKFLKDYQPDFILCTHFLATDIILNSSKKQKINAPVATILTDYDIHNLWLVPGTKHYFVATEKMKQKMIMKNIPEKNITVSGIPVDPIFYKNKNIEQLKKKYNIPKNNKVILVLSGGQGLGQGDKIVKTLFKIEQPISIIAIAGKNKKLEQALKKLKPPTNAKLQSIGWTDAIDEYMRISDIIISKPGGITTSECITLGKPIIATQPIPGQEECNARYILENGLGRVTNHPEDLLYYTNQYLTNKIVYNQKTPQHGAQIILEKILT